MELPIKGKVDCGWSNTVVWNACGIWIVGDNKYGQLALPATATNSCQFVRVDVPGEVESVVCMSEAFIAVTKKEDSRAMFSWGWNEHGNLGLGDKLNRHSPCKIDFDLHESSRVFASGAYFLILH